MKNSTLQLETILLRVKRGEIWLANFNPQTYPDEPAKDNRPCLIMQSDLLNDAGYSSVVVIPCTTATYRDKEGDGFPIKVSLGLIQRPGEQPENTDAFVAGIRAISKRRLKGSQAIAALSRNYLRRVEEALKIVLQT